MLTVVTNIIVLVMFAWIIFEVRSLKKSVDTLSKLDSVEARAEAIAERFRKALANGR